MPYLCSFNLIVSTQSGFRPHHSTESILIKMTDDWLEAMDQGLYTGAIFLDLRNAFDVVNHDLLIAKLQIYGCSPSSLLWFKSYLTDCRRIFQAPYLIPKYCLLVFPRVRSWVLHFSSCLSMTYHSLGKAGMAFLLMMPLSILALQL